LQTRCFGLEYHISATLGLARLLSLLDSLPYWCSEKRKKREFSTSTRIFSGDIGI